MVSCVRLEFLTWICRFPLHGPSRPFSFPMPFLAVFAGDDLPVATQVKSCDFDVYNYTTKIYSSFELSLGATELTPRAYTSG